MNTNLIGQCSLIPNSYELTVSRKTGSTNSMIEWRCLWAKSTTYLRPDRVNFTARYTLVQMACYTVC